MSYVQIADSEGPAREFCISLGLMPGYDATDTCFTEQDALNLLKQWLEKRCQVMKPYFSAGIFLGQIAYAWMNHGKAVAQNEPFVEVRGIVSNIYYSKLKDGDVRDILGELAQFMGAGLRQTRVYVTYRTNSGGEAWAYKLDQSSTPREDAIAAGEQS